MDSTPSPPTNNDPEPEVLKPRVVDVDTAAGGTPTPAPGSPPTAEKQPTHRHSHLPSHKATFIGIVAIIIILAINGVILGFILRKQDKEKDLFNKGQVSISTEDLNKLGINRSVIGDTGVELTVAPDAVFRGKVTVAGATTISGPVTLNDKLTAANASATQLQAGDTTLGKLNVNEDTSLSNLNVRKQLVVSGSVNLQGQATISGNVSINNSLTVTGNVVVGGKLTVSTFGVQTLSIGGHVITNGGTPNIGAGSKIGNNGTVSISGNDTAGTIAINAGTGAGSGTLANIAFKTQFGLAPKVIISPVGAAASNFYLTGITVGGFSIAASGAVSAGQYKFTYIVVQ